MRRCRHHHRQRPGDRPAGDGPAWDFQAKDLTPVGKEALSRKTDAPAMRWWRIPTASSCGRMPGRRKSPC
ncbi:MAG: hypothetical protein ACLTYN_03565 [Dysosmobacter welbionis]